MWMFLRFKSQTQYLYAHQSKAFLSELGVAPLRTEDGIYILLSLIPFPHGAGNVMSVC
jgi:hypothetical protein